MEDIKGNLNNVRESIITIKIRDRDGHPIHKAEFRTDDRATLVKELSILKDKFGMDCFQIKGKAVDIHKEQQRIQAEEEMEKLNDWREKSKGLREPDKEFQEKMKKVL